MAGAVGICAAKVSEAAVMVRAGIGRINHFANFNPIQSVGSEFDSGPECHPFAGG